MKQDTLDRLVCRALNDQTEISFDRDVREETGGKAQVEFEQVFDAVASVRALKIREYGDSRLRLKWGNSMETLMAFSDVHRKYIRLETQVNNKDVHSDDLIETLADMANYTIQMIQILMMIKEGRTEPQ